VSSTNPPVALLDGNRGAGGGHLFASAQPPLLEGFRGKALHELQEAGDIRGLFDEGIGALESAGDALVEIPGQHDDGQRGAAGCHDIEDVPAADLGQVQIQDKQIKDLPFEFVRPLSAIRRHDRLVARLAQHALERFTHGWVVIDNEQSASHREGEIACRLRTTSCKLILSRWVRFNMPAIEPGSCQPQSPEDSFSIYRGCAAQQPSLGFMRGTNYSKGGFRRITRLESPGQVRLLGFGVVVVCGSLLLFWVTRTTWDQLDQLQKEHSAVKSESFYLGVSLRSSIRSLNGKLLQFGLTREPSVRDAFLKESGELSGWMETNRQHLVEIADLRLLQRMELSKDLQLLEKATNAFKEYLQQTAPILAPGQPSEDLDTFEEVYGRVQGSSSGLLDICDELVKVQGHGFSQFLSETQDTLVDHQRLLEISSALILVLAGTLAILVYRGMIAPLRKGLTQSKTIIQRQEKLASLGILASGVAHEIRNPLTAIKFRLFSLKNSLPELSNNEDATLIANEINRLERIVKDFLQFARPSDPEMGRVALQRIVKEVHDLLRMQLERAGIHLKVDVGETVWVHADAQQIKQVLINLIQNAAEAIGRNGRITVGISKSTSELDGHDEPVGVVHVADTGRGIPRDVEARLFDPFFTTKERGTGLGLAVAARIIEKHGGMLRYETELNRGTTFEVVLPQATHDATANLVDRR